MTGQDLLKLDLEKDDPVRIHGIANLYFQGLNVPVDKKRASELYSVAADRGYDQSMLRLGIMYMEGDGIEQDYLEAAKLFQRAADRGNADAMYLLALLYTQGKGVDRIPDRAAHWCFEAAKGGSLGAMVELAIWFRDGDNFVQKDMKQCHYWLFQASLKDYAPAMFELGCMYSFGESVKKDLKNGRYLLMHAAENGDPDADKVLKAIDEGATSRPKEFF